MPRSSEECGCCVRSYRIPLPGASVHEQAAIPATIILPNRRTRAIRGRSGKRWGSVPPEILEAVRRKLGVAYRMLDVLVPEPSLQRPGVVSRIGQRVTASVAQHVREIRSELGSNRPSTTLAD